MWRIFGTHNFLLWSLLITSVLHVDCSMVITNGYGVITRILISFNLLTLFFKTHIFIHFRGTLSTYKELCSLASDLNKPDLVYQFMQLANHNAIWNSKKVLK